jgi:hypothetical protein
VERYWPEPLEVLASASGAGAAAFRLRNPAPVSRYLTSLDIRIDGRTMDPSGVGLVNATPGEAGRPAAAASLAPEAGFYVRRNQDAEVRLPEELEPGPHRVELEMGLAGVASSRVAAEVDF